jgi:hypothetical protein
MIFSSLIQNHWSRAIVEIIVLKVLPTDLLPNSMLRTSDRLRVEEQTCDPIISPANWLAVIE